MKNKIFFGITVTLILLGTLSCEKVIDFDLKKSPQKPVAEAVVNSLQHSASLLLTYSNDYYDTTEFTTIDNADAFLYNDEGETYPLQRVGPGYYLNTLIPNDPDKTWHFHLTLNDTAYEASSTMPGAVAIDSVYYKYSEASLFAGAGYRVWAVFRDPEGEENYFRLKLYVNDKDVTNGVIYLWSDANADGATVQFIFYRHALSAGDRFRVELWAIDKITYNYLFSLQNISTGAQNASLAAPANPQNNWNGDLLGYFTAAGVTTTQTFTITE